MSSPNPHIVLAGTCVELDPEEKKKLLNERLKQLKQAKRDKQLRDEHIKIIWQCAVGICTQYLQGCQGCVSLLAGC